MHVNMPMAHFWGQNIYKFLQDLESEFHRPMVCKHAVFPSLKCISGVWHYYGSLEVSLCESNSGQLASCQFLGKQCLIIYLHSIGHTVLKVF